MSNIDKRALREAAEKATPGNWWIDSHGQAMVSFIENDVLEVFATDNKRAAVRHEDTGNLSRWRNDNDATFIATADPATVLALLNEIAELEQRHCGTALLEREEMHTKTLGRMLDELDAKDKQIADLKATAAHSNAGWKEAHEQEARAEAAEKRIAELEALEVKLPNPHAHLIWIQAGHAPDDYWDDVAVSHSEKDKCCDGSDRYPVYALWEIKEALSAIGINIAAAGKGEDS
ncbi:ead/Ea22-like family protein [Enterobacter kobei]|uniref:ead/Ea22-like family protein n=1 Tax=Enterobacter kobei TaxID=208224 RepID=UPI0029D57D20|nr:ead/Ea22-like family protein [Enterobacter kobei]MDX7049620.1 ead/Ea22-like family protein [Enterobacter kobei]